MDFEALVDQPSSYRKVPTISVHQAEVALRLGKVQIFCGVRHLHIFRLSKEGVRYSHGSAAPNISNMRQLYSSVSFEDVPTGKVSTQLRMDAIISIGGGKLEVALSKNIHT